MPAWPPRDQASAGVARRARHRGRAGAVTRHVGLRSVVGCGWAVGHAAARIGRGGATSRIRRSSVGRRRGSYACGPRQAGRSTDQNCRSPGGVLSPTAWLPARCVAAASLQAPEGLPMQITTRAIVLAVAMLASAPLLAASSGTSTAGTDASTQETQTTTEQDDCTLPTLSSTDLSAGLAGLLPKPGSTPPDTAEVDRRLSKAASCVRPFGLAGMTSQGTVLRPSGAFPLLRCLLVQAQPGLGNAHFWKAHVVQTVFPSSQRKPGSIFDVALPRLRNHQDGRQQQMDSSFRWNDEPERQLATKKPRRSGAFSYCDDAFDQNLYCAETPYRSAWPSNGPARCEPRAVMSTCGASGLR